MSITRLATWEMKKRRYTALKEEESRDWDVDTPQPVIHNIVCTAKLQCSVMPLDLPCIHSLLPGSFYDQRRFAAMTVRLHNPNCTVLLFSSGKLVITGGRNWYDCVLSCFTITNVLRTCMVGNEFLLVSCDIMNVVAHCEIPCNGGTLDLAAMYDKLNLYSTYQKAMFPGLIFRPPASPIVLLCFESGKIVITGGRAVQDMFEGWARWWPVVKSFIRNRVTSSMHPCESDPLPEKLNL